MIISYIFDSHRPYHHANINDPLQRICVIHDGCKSFNECPTEDDVKFVQELNDDDSEEEYGSDFDSEEVKEELEDLKDSDDEEDVYGEKVEKRKDEGEEDEENEVEGDEEDIDGIKVGKKRQREEEK